MRFKNVENKIVEVLKAHPEARNSNDELVIAVWEAYGISLTPQQVRKLKDIPSFETITRVRRKLNEQGLYLATPNVQSFRKTQEISYKNYAKKNYKFVGNRAIEIYE